MKGETVRGIWARRGWVSEGGGQLGIMISGEGRLAGRELTATVHVHCNARVGFGSNDALLLSSLVQEKLPYFSFLSRSRADWTLKWPRPPNVTKSIKGLPTLLPCRAYTTSAISYLYLYLYLYP